MSVDILFLPAKKPSNKTLLFVGGSGEDKDTYRNGLISLQDYFPQINTCSFSYTNNSESAVGLLQTIPDLQVVLAYLRGERKQSEISIWAASMGAYPTCKMLGSNEFADVIDKVMFCDPADYPQKDSVVKTWSGYEKFDSKMSVGSDWLKTMDSNTRVRVVHFLLKNYGPDGYIDSDYKDRGMHHENGFTRLNTDMVKAFWEKLPEKNRDEYIEDSHIPHAILRDGNIEENQKRLVKLISNWLS